MEGAMEVLGSGALSADKLEEANINPATGLATDYLNHFNEVVMLLEMIPDMPMCAEDILEWQPKNYIEHFTDSTFKDKQLAIAAYQASPKEIRAPLETIVAQINECVLKAQDKIRSASSPELIAEELGFVTTETIKPLVAMAGGVIHGQVSVEAIECEGDEAQAQIDAMFA